MNSNIIKIKSLGLTKLNNAEYINFMNRFRSLIPSESENERPEEVRLQLKSSTPSTLGITDEQLADFDANCALMTDLVNQSHTSDETVRLLDLDKQRDDLVVYCTTSITQMKKSPITAQKNAATSLYNTIKPYIGIYKSANQQETQQIFGLLADLDTAGNKEKVSTLGLTPVVDELRTVNQQYAACTNQRTLEHAASLKENSATVRSRLDRGYDELTTMAFVQSIAQPTEDTETFVRNLNVLIDETSALYNQRIAAAKAGKKGENERPEEV